MSAAVEKGREAMRSQQGGFGRVFVTVLCGALFAAAAAARAQDARLTYPLNSGWRFEQTHAEIDAERPEFADRSWRLVDVPHSWNRVGLYEAGNPSHINKPEDINKVQGVGWYRLTFDAPKALTSHKAWLQFDGASVDCQVWLNGVKLGEHRGAFSRFRLDATTALRPGESNVLAVKTDNNAPGPGSVTADILPIIGDFFIYGGLYRPVSLIGTSPVHVDMLDYGGPGVYLRTERITTEAAAIKVGVKLRNDDVAETDAAVHVSVRDADDHEVAAATATTPIEPGGSAQVDQSVDVPNPHLWQGTSDPFLYTINVEVQSPSGAVLDRVTQRYGIRQIKVDAERGLILNGKPTPLHGVTLHQDREGKGWAVSQADLREDMALITEMGANTIRLTHYQHSPFLHDLADEQGVILWDEIPFVTKWTNGASLEPTAALAENAEQQLIELIRQNENHASVAVWGLANEVDFGLKAPAFLGGDRKPPLPDPLPLLAKLRQLATVEDPTRPTTIANCCFGREGAPDVVSAADLSGSNRYFGWYYGTPADMGTALDKLHGRFPAKPMGLSEYGAGASLTEFTDNPLGGPHNPRGRPQPEDYQSYFHESMLPLFRARPYLWGTWTTFMFDFASAARSEGDSVDINTKGLVSADRRARKDAFYLYKANWSPAPTVHIADRRYVNRRLPVVDVKIYSNAAATEAWLNGKSLGVRSDCPNRVCVWSDVKLSSGANEIRGAGGFPSGKVEDSVSWTLVVADDVYRIKSGSIVGADGPEGVYGSDDYFTGGGAGRVTAFGDFGARTVLTPIEGTMFPELFNAYRKGDFAYRFALRNGSYRLKLKFVEPNAAPGARVFAVLANGVKVLEDLDIATEAGGSLKALEKTLVVEVSNGALDLRFKPSKGEAIVSAIDLEPRGSGE